MVDSLVRESGAEPALVARILSEEIERLELLARVPTFVPLLATRRARDRLRRR